MLLKENASWLDFCAGGKQLISQLCGGEWTWQSLCFTLTDEVPIVCHHQPVSLVPVRSPERLGPPSADLRQELKCRSVFGRNPRKGGGGQEMRHGRKEPSKAGWPPQDTCVKPRFPHLSELRLYSPAGQGLFPGALHSGKSHVPGKGRGSPKGPWLD